MSTSQDEHEPQRKRSKLPLVAAAALLTLVALAFIFTRPQEGRAASDAADAISKKDWRRVYELGLPQEKALLGWTPESFDKLMTEVCQGCEVHVMPTDAISPSGGSRIGALYAMVATKGTTPGEDSLQLYVIGDESGYRVAIGDLPFQMAMICARSEPEGMARLVKAMDSAGVERLINVRDMLVLTHERASNYGKSGGSMSLSEAWTRHPGF